MPPKIAALIMVIGMMKVATFTPFLHSHVMLPMSACPGSHNKGKTSPALGMPRHHSSTAEANAWCSLCYSKQFMIVIVEQTAWQHTQCDLHHLQISVEARDIST